VICPAIKAVKKPEESAKKVQIRMRFLIIFLFRAKAQRSKGAKEEITPFAFWFLSACISHAGSNSVDG
jgi:hypothetical protein